MTTTNTETSRDYIFETSSGSFNATFDGLSGLGYGEDDLNNAAQAYADALNSAGTLQITKVSLYIEYQGLSGWSYTPAS